MNWKTHVIVGGVTGFVLGVDPILSCAGSLLPDCDSRHALAGRRMMPLWLLRVKHRSRVTHSWIPVAFLTIITVCFGWNWGLVIGYMSHLLLDSTTPAGIPIWGHKHKRYRFLFFPVSKRT